MKRMVMVALLAILVFPIVAHAQAGFLFGYVIGSSTSGGKQMGGGGENIIYELPYASERIKSPLDIKQIAVYAEFVKYMEEEEGKSIRGLFNRHVKGAGSYEILQVVRVVNPANVISAAYWFSYIEKSQVGPIPPTPEIPPNPMVPEPTPKKK